MPEIMTLEHSLATWLPAQRWYPGGSAAADLAIIADTPLASGDPALRHLIISVSSGGDTVRYQVLAGIRAQVPAGLGHAVIGPDGHGGTAYDALHDPELTGVLLRGIAAERVAGPLRFVAEPAAAIDETAASLVLSAEQSNTSLIFGESAILKVFRRVFPGQNPDLEVAHALAGLGSPHVARPFGWIEASLENGDGDARADRQPGSAAAATDARGGASAGHGRGGGHGEPALLALLSEYLRGACDGWSLAETSLRDLYAAGTSPAADAGGDFAGEAHQLGAADAGGDFAGEAHRLGAATASVHADLATAFGTSVLEPDEVAALAARMTSKLAEASAEVPELAPMAAKVEAHYARLAGLGAPLPVQRVHGDYHLGQVMRTQTGWVALDFEGEPAAPLARRRSRSPALQDVAGMLRSFDYAARHLLLGHPDEARLSAAARDWVDRNSAAFCAGYTEVSGADPRAQGVLLRALMLDKAVYEVTYEARHRPSWQSIPLSAIVGSEI
jgi:maltokinase